MSILAMIIDSQAIMIVNFVILACRGIPRVDFVILAYEGIPRAEVEKYLPFPLMNMQRV